MNGPSSWCPVKTVAGLPDFRTVWRSRLFWATPRRGPGRSARRSKAKPSRAAGGRRASPSGPL